MWQRVNRVKDQKKVIWCSVYLGYLKATWRYKICLLLVKNISLVHYAHSQIFFSPKEKFVFVSPSGHVTGMFYLLY